MTLTSLAATLVFVSSPCSEPVGNSVIKAPYAGSEIVITTTSRVAGAIHSLKWDGVEFIDSRDHGRQLQSASNFDAGSKFSGETFNPTEAGSRRDGAGSTSSSKLLHLISHRRQLQTTTQMAFWLRPGDKSANNIAKNKTIVSNHLLTKRVVIGYRDMPNVVQYDATFTLPVDEKHTYAQFEAVTGYMPPAFSKFYTCEPVTGKLNSASDGPGEQNFPLVFSTEDGSHAMGIYSPQQPSKNYENAGYGRWRFSAQRVVKWNCVFRIQNAKGIPADDYRFRNFVIIGSRDVVASTIKRLAKLQPER
ncbi:MAG: hypothetical protein AB8G99_19495 [Planctomycetaceae bacterium]